MRKTIVVFAALSTMFLSWVQASNVKIWTSDMISDEMSPKAVKELKPIGLVGVRNGSYSGKIVVDSVGDIKGLKVSAGVLTGKDGTVIPATNVQIRYAKAWDTNNMKYIYPEGADILLETPPEIPVVNGRAVLPVWVTVKVPMDVKAGIYTGEVSVKPQGSSPVSVKVNLEVMDWTLPDPQNYRTWSDFIQSPDTLALEYNVPLWSEKHWKLIERSFQYLSPTGARMLYVPLICRTNFGNEQSMVRWIKKGENKYEYDYTILDKYLDSAEKNLGKPKLVMFIVWDIVLSAPAKKGNYTKGWHGVYSEEKGKAIVEGRDALAGKGPRVTVLDPAKNEVATLALPYRYENKESKTLWQPMFSEVRKRMQKRGLEKTMMLGTLSDIWPSKEETAFWQDVSGGLPWVLQGHLGAVADLVIGHKGLNNIADIGYSAYVQNKMYNINPDKGRMYGWKNKELRASYFRAGGFNFYDILSIREMQAFNITGVFHGEGRMGGDYWWAVRNKKGERAGHVHDRFPESNWHNLDILDWALAPGPDGAVSTARLESLKEGTQVCEVRIFLEDALLDNGKKNRLGAELVGRCQAALDEHHRAMWKTVWNNDKDLNSIGKVGDISWGGDKDPVSGLWSALEKSGKKMPSFHGEGKELRASEAEKGRAWFALGWQDREKKLFALAGEVVMKLNSK